MEWAARTAAPSALPPVPQESALSAEAAIRTVPLRPPLLRARAALALPVGPELPELPDIAVGSAMAVELAGPVLPVLVAEDWAHEVPESPDLAVGSWVISTEPPSPPLASRLAMESPPVTAPPLMRLRRPRTLRREFALPALSDRAEARKPPVPPLPPAARPLTSLEASP